MSTAGTQELGLSAAVRHAFETLSSPTPSQHLAWQRFIARGLPPVRAEQWKYAQLHRLYSQPLNILANADVTYPGPPWPSSDATICVVNGHLQSMENLPPGVEVSTGTLATTPGTAPPPTLTATDKDDDSSAFVALSEALADSVITIRVAADTTIHSPIRLVLSATCALPSVAATHVRIQLEHGAHLRLIEDIFTPSNDQLLHLISSRIDLAAGSTLEHTIVQESGQNTFHIASQHVDVERNSRYYQCHFNLGGTLGRLDTNIALMEREAFVHLTGLQFATNTQVLDTHSCIRHQVAHTRSTEIYHSIADGRSQVVFNGKVWVYPQANDTDAHQTSRNLLLSSRAEIDTKPELEIYNDDVKCAHGATVGHLDAAALFYLRSRGLDEAEARAALTVGFAEGIISHALPPVQTRLRKYISDHFGHSLEGG